MGAIGSVLGGTLFGVGMSAMNSSKPSYTYGTDAHANMATEVPEVPTATDSDYKETNTLMEAGREKEKQKAAWRREQAKEVFTSGLGASGLAETNHKSLLGG